MSIGGPVRGIGSPPEGDFFTEDDLKDFAKQTNAVLDEIRPFNKIGHSPAQILARRSGFYQDDQPQTGRLANLRVEGGKLLTDLKGVPAKLADLIEAGAFPERSVETKPYESQAGKGKFDKVIRALSWQGAKAPAIKTLDDIVALYGDDEPEDDPELKIYTWTAPGEAPTLDLNIELTPGERKLGDPDDTRGVATGTETKPLALDEEQTTKIAEIFGVDELTPDVLLEKATEMKALAEKSAAEGDPDPSPDPDPTPDLTPDPEPKGDEGEPSRQLAEAEYNDLLARANAGAAAAEKLAKQERDALLVEAMKDGRIDPAQREEFVKLYEEDADYTSRVLSILPPNPERAEIFGAEGEREFTEDDDALYKRYGAFANIEPIGDEAA